MCCRACAKRTHPANEAEGNRTGSIYIIAANRVICVDSSGHSLGERLKRIVGVVFRQQTEVKQKIREASQNRKGITGPDRNTPAPNALIRREKESTERLDGYSFVIFYVEDRIKFGDLQ